MARLIESSLWVDFTRKKSPLALKASIQPWILDPEACLCEPIAFEVLRHATPQERIQIEAQFATLPILSTPARLWWDATRLGQACRDKGHTAGSLDLIIAAITIHHGAELVTFDADYEPIAQYSDLNLRLLKRPDLHSS
jgi:predicted nucleic acid-binding protein